jgi:hypothetical protein
MSYTSTCPITYFIQKNVKKIQKMYIHAYKKISCKSFDLQKKIEQCQEAEKNDRANWKSTPQKSNGLSLSKKNMLGKVDSGYVFMSRNHETSPNPHP